MLLPQEFQQLGEITAAGTLFLQNVVLSSQTGYFGREAVFIPLLHLWSLAVEEQFYLFFPLLLGLFWKRHLPVGWMLTALMIASLLLSLSSTEANAGEAFYFTPTRAWEFLVGALLAWFCVRRILPQCPRCGSWLAAGGTACLVLSFFLLNDQSIYPGWRAALPVLGAVLLIAAGHENGVSRILYSNRLMVGIGLISYPLYLFHWPILSFGRIVHGGPVSWRFTLGAIGLSFLLAVATYGLVERKWRHARSRWAVPCLAGAFAITGFVGLAVSHGWISPRSDTPELALVIGALREKHLNLRLPGISRRKAGEYAVGGSGPCTLFVGDSFCGQCLPRLGAVLGAQSSAARGAVLLFGAAVPPIPGVVNSAGKDGSHLTQSMLELVKSNPAIDRVVLAACWPFYFDPNQRYAIGGQSLTQEPGRLAALASLTALLRDLGAQGKKVYVVLDPPWDDRLAPERFLKRSFLGVKLAPPPPLPYEAFLDRGLYSLRELRKSIKALCGEVGVEVIDPSDDLVVDGLCVAADENGPIRSDMSHLRGSYMRDKVRYLDRLLLP